MGNLFKLMLLLHIACVVLGFGAVAYNGVYRAKARRMGGAGEVAALEAVGEVNRIAEFVIYAVFVLGILVSLTSKVGKTYSYPMKDGWLSASVVLYLIDMGILHGFVKKTERQYGQLIAQVNGGRSAPSSADAGQLTQLEQRINLGWAAFDVIFLVVMYLMVFTPGH